MSIMPKAQRASILTALVLGLSLTAGPPASGAPDEDDGDEDLIVEREPRNPRLLRVTHVFKKAKPQSSCTCGVSSPTDDDYALLNAKWASGFQYKIFTRNFGPGPAVAGPLHASFQAWMDAHGGAPLATLTATDDTSSPPAIALDDVQAVTCQDLRRYGRRTLAVTVYWVNGAGEIVHFDMGFNISVQWANLSAVEACGGSGSEYDVQNVATHEAGHVYGIGHSNGCNLTMNPTARVGETLKRTLAIGDTLGIQARYP